ncbi:MerC domain-containing protein [Ulvibacterium sp.]|uniref:MerC domain-containing protein n=1 Tax=Ulvibacterium sp. TaxID=2665914 RepID=UPI00260AB2A2|nr:MerC domain-containing protein [Ulvibacterium sp.]
MTLVKVINKSDYIGIFASGLCLLHCLATPFLFVAHANMELHADGHPFWWGFMDVAFLLLSFLAVYWSVKNTSKKWIVYTFWILWGLLALIILNEKWALWHLVEEAIYFPTVGLVLLHFYNRRYCHCEDAHCCTDQQ